MIQKPYGTNDILPSQTPKWQYIEKAARETAALYGFSEIRFPSFESTELFQRGVGDTTDVVQKEMYTFEAVSYTHLVSFLIVAFHTSYCFPSGMKYVTEDDTPSFFAEIVV